MDVYLLEELLEKEPIRIKINELKSKQRRLKFLLVDIVANRHRVQTILMWMTDADGEEAIQFTLKLLACEELLPEEQHLQLDALLEEKFNFSWLATIYKDIYWSRS